MTQKQGWYYLAQDSAEPVGPFPTQEKAERASVGVLFAFDRGSARHLDAQGFLHVDVNNISKANVCPYRGEEIPDWEMLKLDPKRIYQLLRDPEELRKAAPSFNNVPLLSKHVPVDAGDHQPDLIIGSTGTDAAFKEPYLQNSLVVWVKDYILAIDDDEQKELSSAYRYRADMTPGEYQGVPYDGVMRDIVGNHVALVKEGRAGADVVVGDSKEELYMTNAVLSRKATFAMGAVMFALQPKLAADAKLELEPIFAGVSAKNFGEKKPSILKGLTAALKGKLAADAQLDHLPELLDRLEKSNVMEGADADPDTGLPLGKEELLKDKVTQDDPADGDDDEKKRREFLAGKLSAEDMSAYDALCATSSGAKPTPAGDAEVPARQPDMVTKPAMDAALEAQRKQILADGKATREAEQAVEPYIGKLAMAHDSADAVYRTALGAMGVDVKDVKELPALKAILKAQPLPGAKPNREVTMAEDSAAGTDGFHGRFKNAARIKHV